MNHHISETCSCGASIRLDVDSTLAGAEGIVSNWRAEHVHDSPLADKIVTGGGEFVGFVPRYDHIEPIEDSGDYEVKAV